MAIMQDRETFGRARLSFAERVGHRRVRHACSRGSRTATSAPTSGARSVCCAAPTASARTATRRCCASRFRRASWAAQQLDAVASVAERYSRGFGHITTRQNIQLHFVKLHDAEPAMRELAAAGMTTREACGNSVRNITACPYSGVAERRSVRRHAVCGGADALSAAPSAELGAAAQVQDRL